MFKIPTRAGFALAVAILALTGCSSPKYPLGFVDEGQRMSGGKETVVPFESAVKKCGFTVYGLHLHDFRLDHRGAVLAEGGTLESVTKGTRSQSKFTKAYIVDLEYVDSGNPKRAVLIAESQSSSRILGLASVLNHVDRSMDIEKYSEHGELPYVRVAYRSIGNTSFDITTVGFSSDVFDSVKRHLQPVKLPAGK